MSEPISFGPVSGGGGGGGGLPQDGHGSQGLGGGGGGPLAHASKLALADDQPSPKHEALAVPAELVTSFAVLESLKPPAYAPKLNAPPG